MLVSLLLAASAAPEPSASPTTLKTIIRVRASPLCTTVESNVLYTLQGLQADDRVVESAKPVLVNMGREFAPNNTSDEPFNERQARYNGTVPGGAHDPDPALELDNLRLKRLVDKIVHNLAIIDALLNDPARFPAVAKTADDDKARLLKAQLQAIADQQRRNLNVLNGLADTFSLQALLAKGDGTQGAINGPGAKTQVSHNDQDVSFQDVISGPERGRIGSPVDPTVDQNPAISQAPTDLSNNPMARLYLGVTKIQQSTAEAENALTQTVLAVTAGCRQ